MAKRNGICFLKVVIFLEYHIKRRNVYISPTLEDIRVFLMQSHKIFFAVVLAFGIIGMVRIPDFARGDIDFMLVNANNEGSDGLDNLQVRVFIYDLGVVLQTDEFDLDSHDTAGKLLYWNAPNDAKPGDYWARITASNDDAREATHRIIRVV